MGKPLEAITMWRRMLPGTKSLPRHSQSGQPCPPSLHWQSRFGIGHCNIASLGQSRLISLLVTSNRINVVTGASSSHLEAPSKPSEDEDDPTLVSNLSEAFPIRGKSTDIYLRQASEKSLTSRKSPSVFNPAGGSVANA
ncbi:hypothetical protein AKJ16_DCAP03932 [Drosera capensis]